MEYNSMNIQKNFFIYLRVKGKKRWKSNICFEKCYFSIPFFPRVIANKRFNCINKIFWCMYFDSYWFILIFTSKKRMQKIFFS